MNIQEQIQYLNDHCNDIETLPDDTISWYFKGGYCNGLSILFDGKTFSGFSSSEYEEGGRDYEFGSWEEILEAISDTLSA